VGSISHSLQLAPKISDKVIAAYLAQEGIELVRNIRDVNWINNVAFNTGLIDGWGCVQYNANSIDVNCLGFGVGGGDNLKFDGTYYSHDVGVATIFSRRVTITNVSAVEVLVQSNVTCGNNCSVSLESHLFDWR